MTSCILLALKRLASLSVLGVLFWNLGFLLQSSHIPAGGASTRDKPLSILIWDLPFNHNLNLSGHICATGRHHKEGCLLTSNRSWLDQADVVAFHHRELQRNRSRLPRAKKKPGQNWVWVSLESPTNTKDLAGWNGTFNWVMTYRQDSDIFIPYGVLVPHLSDKVDIPKKSHLVCWVISNYHRTQKRAELYRELSRHIKIDVYGKASKKPLCPACLLPTISQYKFYLAFENSIHQDYITEKLWRNALLAGTIPVVMGPPRANYEQLIPGEAFIHVEDFGSMQELATFLLTMNDSHYQSFFSWRHRYTVKLYDNWQERFCTICDRYPSLLCGKVYPSLEDWFQNERSGLPGGP
ncbi:PREDICTED: alpha-(1,3)-fucosyltransferase 7 [Gekko japonicus]|uniref:Fucosyltransferase n=1 Tax=Gekko japonicus TaxID=146911 RepID=A0ABM1L7P1_GEKJA|nr:PREDICTED: alpha-(1,3)-fucosyltransferase 7 [Gekko japonicus]